MTDYFGEVLYRQGWHTRRFGSHAEALEWTAQAVIQARGTVNPSRKSRVREVPTFSEPTPPERTFDETYPLDPSEPWP